MDVQRELISRIIHKQELKDVLDRRVEPFMFTDKESREVFQGIMKFYNDYMSLPSIDWVEHEYPAYKLTYAKQPVRYYIDEVYKLYSIREVEEAMIKSAGKLHADPLAEIDNLRARFSRLMIHARPTHDVDVTLKASDRFKDYEYREEIGGMDGWSYPWATLNDATWGIHNGEFIVFAARPGVGKTWEEIVIANHLNVAERKNGLFITNEMAAPQLTRRYDAVKFKLPYQQFRSGCLNMVQKEAYRKGLEALEKDDVKLHIIGGQGLGVGGIAQKIEQYQPDFVAIDGFYLTPDDLKGKDVWSRTTNVSRGLKQLALHYNIPVIGTTQFNRGVSEKAEEAELGNIGFADAIGQDADVVVGLIRTKDMKLNNELQISVLKSREGDTPTFRHRFDLETMSFDDMNTVIQDRFKEDDDEGLDF
jgi:replicative DNA helicase